MIYMRRKLLYGVFIVIFLVFLRVFYFSQTQVNVDIPITLPKTTAPTFEGVKDITLVMVMPKYPQKIARAYKNTSIPVVYISDSYVSRNSPPLQNSNAKFVNIGVDLLNPSIPKDPLDHVETNFILMPMDFPKELSNADAKLLIKYAKQYPKDLFIVPYKTETPLQCMNINLNLKQWTLEYSYWTDKENACMAAKGNFALFTRNSLLKQFTALWLRPFPEALLIEAAARGIHVRLLHDLSLDREKLWTVADSRKKILERVEMYDKLQIKKVVRTGVVEWYGCTRNTTRCFGTIHDDTPDYLMQGRWTPPCCLRVLRETAKHVFGYLKSHKVRYWLEGGSLLGAMRSGDIIPWDYDVDLGVYEKDLDNISHIRELKKLAIKGVKMPSIVDKQGYVWESSRPNEGRHYRVQASRTNRLHVDIFPFYPRNGIMTKDTWLPHKQDMEFPETFLKPLTEISFIGTTAFAPNNIRDFLEMKFGAGCIENPQYPNPSLVPFPSVKPSEATED